MLQQAARSSTERDCLEAIARRLGDSKTRLDSIAGLGPLLLHTEVPHVRNIVGRLAGISGIDSIPLGASRQTGSAYERHKARARKYSARQSAAGREIGPLPPVADPERRAACERDLGLYLKTFHAPAFPLAWSSAHEVAIQRAEIVVLLGALFALAMPRGTGKTTVCRATVQWAINYGHRRYAYLIGANDDKGEEALQAIQLNYETNELLLADFPEICYPLWKLEGVHNRAKGQLLNGRRTRIQFKKRTMILPTVLGSASSGSVIKCGGLLSSVRGANLHLPDGRIIRPDLVVLDDPQTRESAESPPQSATRLRIISADVLGMAGPGQTLAALMPCTVIAPGDAMDQVLDPHLHPEWRPLRTAMLESFPDEPALELWEKYWDIFQEELRKQQGLADSDDAEVIPAKATAYYKKHRKVMDRGAVASWPQRHRPDEISAIQHAMNLYFQNREAFHSEYQNQPLDARVEETFLAAAEIMRKTNSYRRGEVPLGCEWVVFAIDVHKRVLIWSVLGIEPDFTSYVLDYGAFPQQNRPNFRVSNARPTLQEVYKGAGEEGAISQGIGALGLDLLSRKWKREDGLELQAAGGLVDTAYNSNTVKKAIRLAGLVGRLHPSFGKGFSANETPISSYRQKPGERIGEEFILRRAVARIRHMLVDVNYWKTFAHRRLLTATGDPGALTLFGREANGKKAVHEYFARQVDSEVRRVEEGDRRVDVWTRRPNAENHWLDTTVYSLVMGGLCGAKTGAPKLSKGTAVARPRPQPQSAPALLGRDGRSFFVTDRD